MNVSTPTLLELQRAVCRDLLGLVGDSAAEYVVPDGLEPQARIAIYRNTTTATLVRALRLSYPAVRSLVGPEFFEGSARLFIEQNPPLCAHLDSYGAAFPDFLAQMPQAASLAYLPDTARLEWAVNDVLHAPDTKPLDLARLAQLEQEEMEAVRFRPSPSVRLLRSTFPVDAIWRAVLTGDDSVLAGIDLATDPVWLYVRRTVSGVDVERIAEWQWRFTAALLSGCPLHLALVEAPDADADVWLASLLASGCFADINLPGPICNSPTGGLIL